MCEAVNHFPKDRRKGISEVSTQIGIGFSRHLDHQQAAREAALQAKTGLRTTNAAWAMLLCAGHCDPHKIVPIVNETLRNPRLIGCSTAGIILSNSIETRGGAVLAIASDEMKFADGFVDHIESMSPQNVGMELARRCLNDFGAHGRQVFVFFVDSRFKNISPLLKSIQGTLGNIFPVVGAGSCSHLQDKDAFKIYRNRVLTNAVSGVIMGGHMTVGVGSQHGWRPLGKPRTITGATDNIIESIDGRPAYDIYEQYFEEEAAQLRGRQSEQMSILYPLGIFIEESRNYLLRNAVDIRSDGSIVCQGDIPQGTRVHLMIGNKESCKQAARSAAEEAHQNLLGKDPKLIIVLESMSRLKLLGRMAFQEIVKIKEIFGSRIPILGMYTNGEVSPMQSAERFKRPHLQNESITVLAIG